MYGNSFSNSVEVGDEPRPPAGVGMLQRSVAGGILMSMPQQR
jgi:hypothetical protein